MLKIGFSVASITPEPGLRMSGMLNPPKAEGARWPLCARTVVFDDGVQKAAVVSVDILVLMPSTVAEFRQAVASATGLAPQDVMISCTHTHRAPYTAALMDEDPDFAFIDFMRQQIVLGVTAALANRRPARLKAGAVDAPGWTFNPIGRAGGHPGPGMDRYFRAPRGPGG